MPERLDQLSSTGAAPPAPARRRSGLPDGWPVLALFGAFPVWWALGLSSVIWIVLALPMLGWLLARGRVRVPKGFGLWLAFLFWMLLSATQLDEARRWYAFSYRAVLYLSMTVMFVYVYNLPRPAVPARRIVLALTLFWATVICFGFVALAIPNARLTTPASLLLPESIAVNPFAQDLVSARLAQVQTFIGYALPRPAAPFTYTNEWGGAVGLLTPMALAGLGMLRSYLTRNVVRLLLVASLVPIVISANRGLWVGLGVGLVYAAVRVALRGNARSLVAIWASWPWSPPWSPSPRWSATSATGWPTSTATSAAPAWAARRSRGRWNGPCSATAGRGSHPTWSTPPRSAPTARSTWSCSPRASPAWPSSSAGGCGRCGSPAGAPPARPCGAT